MLDKYAKLRNTGYTSENVVTDLSKPGPDVLAQTTAETKTALERFTQNKIKSIGINKSFDDNRVNKFIRYTPGQQGLTTNSVTSQRIIKMTELPKDPLEPVKFKHKRIPRDPGAPPIPVMHSPPRKLTLKDQQDWKIPPCISNWKNQRGYTIPLEMRLSADGRNYKDYAVSEKFSKLADVLYITEKQARKEIEERNKIQESIKMVDTLKKEQELKEAAKEARMKKMAMAVSNISSVNTTKTDDTEIMLGRKRSINEVLEKEKNERDELRNLRKKEIERTRKIEIAGKKGKKILDEERDISEKIALGQAQPSMKESIIDARLYGQSMGVDAGFKDDEDNDLYDKPLFVDRTAASIYKNYRGSGTIDDDESKGEKDQSKKLMEKIYQRGKMFEGADLKVTGGGRPVEFEKAKEKYGLDHSHGK